jgi:hypothetical protein
MSVAANFLRRIFSPSPRVEETKVVIRDSGLIQTPVELTPQPVLTKLLPNAIVRILKSFALGYPKDRNSSGWAKPEYDLAEVDRAENTEAVLKMSISKYTEKILNCGWYFRSANPRTRAYIRKRLGEFAMVTSQPFELLLAEFTRNFVKYNNAFLYVRRNKDFSSGKPIKLYGKDVDPIAGIFLIDPTSMEPRVDKYNNVTQWKQEVVSFSSTGYWNEKGATHKTYERENILHLYRNRTTGFVLGTPDYLPVFDDIRSLRNIEELSDLLIHTYAFPTYHIIVGNKDNPASKMADGIDEVEYVKAEFEKMATEAAFVTSEKVEIKVVGAERYALNLEPFMENYKERVQAGVYLSDIDAGKGGTANRSTAQQLSYGFQERCKDFQRHIEHFMTYRLFNQLLLEGGFSLDTENMVEFKFHEIDVDNRLKVANHAMAMYQGHMITQTEARTMADQRPIESSQEADMYFEKVEKKIALIGAVDESSGLGAKTATTNRNQPTNQHGTKPAKTQTKNDQRYLQAELQTQISKLLRADCDAKKLSTSLARVGAELCLPMISDGVASIAPDLYVGTNINNGFSMLLEARLAVLFDGMSEMFADVQTEMDRSIVEEIVTDEVAGLAQSWLDIAHAYGVLRAQILTKDKTRQDLYNTTYGSLLQNIEENL